MQKTIKLLFPYIFLLPACIILILFFFYPIIDVFYLSLTKYNIVSEPIFIGLKNFQKLYRDKIFWIALKNSIIFLIGAVPPLVIIPIFLAVLINNAIKGISFFRALFYLPSIISIIVIGIAWKWLYSENGPLNYILNLLHITNSKLLWLSSPNLALISVIIVIPNYINNKL